MAYHKAHSLKAGAMICGGAQSASGLFLMTGGKPVNLVIRNLSPSGLQAFSKCRVLDYQTVPAKQGRAL